MPVKWQGKWACADVNDRLETRREGTEADVGRHNEIRISRKLLHMAPLLWATALMAAAAAGA